MENHPDLMALAEGRLEPEENTLARRHLEACPECQQDYESIKEAVMQLQNVTETTQRACPGSRELYDMLDERIGTPSVIKRNEPDYVLWDAKVEKLPPKLASALAGSRKPEASEDRLMRVIRAITGKSGEAAQSLAGKILGGAGLQAGAPAIREDATKEDGGEADLTPEIKDDGDEDKGE